MNKYIIVYYKSDAPHGYEKCMRSLPMTKEGCHRHLIKNEFFELVEEKERHLDELAVKTTLPDFPDYDSINAFIKEVNTELISRNS